MGEGREHDWACWLLGMFSIVPCVIRDVIMIKARETVGFGDRSPSCGRAGSARRCGPRCGG